MNSHDLRSFLITNNNIEAPDWETIKRTYKPEPIDIIKGQNVYEFNLIFDPKINLIEDNIFISQVPPTTDVPIHVHQYIELIYVYQGYCTVLLRDDEIKMSENEIIVIDKNTAHTVKATSGTDIVIEMKLKHDYLSSRFLNQFTNKSIITQFLIDSLIDSRRANNYLYFPFKERSNIIRIMEQIMCEYFEKDVFTGDLIDSYLFIMFTELIRYSNNQSNNPKENSRQKETLVLDFLKYIENHYKECSLTDMAKQYRYHPNYISAVLKKETGKSFTDLLQIQRLNKAALYLRNSDLPIPDIAEEVGYSSLSFFYKKFNEIFLQTPKEYRDNKK
jgi:YesN/AraC family two-component response regulator